MSTANVSGPPSGPLALPVPLPWVAHHAVTLFPPLPLPASAASDRDV